MSKNNDKRKNTTVWHTKHIYFYFFPFLCKNSCFPLFSLLAWPLQNCSSQQCSAEFIVHSFATSAWPCHTELWATLAELTFNGSPHPFWERNWKRSTECKRTFFLSLPSLASPPHLLPSPFRNVMHTKPRISLGGRKVLLKIWLGFIFFKPAV